MSIRVYVAASSAEIPRAKKWIAALREAGVFVTSKWPEIIEKVGDANPRDATHEQRKGWAWADLVDVKDANLLWLLAPEPNGGSARGAYVELGYARALGLSLMISGDTKQSIFTALGVEHETDDAAFAEIVDRHKFYAARNPEIPFG